MKGDIFIAVCTLGTVRAEWAVGLASMHQATGRTQQLALIRDVTTVQDARNLAMNLALAGECDYLLFWDDDMIPQQSDASKRLITALDQHDEIDVVGAVYPMRRNLAEPCVVQNRRQGIYWGWRDGMVHPVYMTGTGFMAIRLSSVREKPVEVYEIAGYQLGRYFDMGEDGMGGIKTDDFYFAEWCEENEIQQYVHGGVRCNQVSRDGTIYRVEDAEVAVA